MLTQLTTPWSFGVPVRLSLEGGLLLTSWAVHAMTRDKPTLLSLHTLPGRLDATLSLAQARLRQLETIWTPAGPASN